MFTKQVFRRCLVPVSLGAIGVEATGNQQIQKEHQLCRPSELPLYTPEQVNITHVCEKDNRPDKLEGAVRNVRFVLEEIYKEVDAYKRVGVEQIEKRKDDVDWLVNYLRQEDNPLPKVGAIGIGALTGLIFGLRGGFFKKTLYATTGALGMTAVCYPKEAKEYSQVGISEVKKYMIVGYNFINGVKKDDPPLELPSLPTLPTNLTEAWETVKSTFVSDGKAGAVEAKAEEQEQAAKST